MKRHQLAVLVGTLALLTNFLVPGLAFGLDPEQVAGISIACVPTGSLAFAEHPADVIFTTIVYSASGEYFLNSIDSAITSNAELPAANKITIRDTRFSGASCPILQPGFTLQVQGTDLQGPSSYKISGDNVRLLTSPNVAGQDSAWPNLANFSEPSGPGNEWGDAQSPVNTTAPYTKWTGFLSYSTYLNDTCHMNTVCTILSRTAPTNSDVTIGTALAVVSIARNQRPGVYTGTVTYSLTPA
jgi:hypothetical protein